MGYMPRIIAKESIIVAQGPALIAQGANSYLPDTYEYL
jgi:hypothetical protein